MSGSGDEASTSTKRWQHTCSVILHFCLYSALLRHARKRKASELVRTAKRSKINSSDGVRKETEEQLYLVTMLSVCGSACGLHKCLHMHLMCRTWDKRILVM